MTPKTEDYQLPEDEVEKKFNPEAPANKIKMLLSALQQKRVRMALALTVGLFAFTHLISYFSGDHADSNGNHATKNPVPTMAEKPSQPISASHDQVHLSQNQSSDDTLSQPTLGESVDGSSTTKKSMTFATGSSSDVNALKTSFNQEQSKVDRKLRSLKKEQSSLHRDVEKLSYQVNAMRAMLQQVNDRQEALVKVQASLLKTELQRKEALQKQLRGTIQKEQAVYVLKAAIDGRAWVEDLKEGSTISVGVGDEVEDYGKIMAIDPVRGMVTTSSGRTIELGSNDH